MDAAFAHMDATVADGHNFHAHGRGLAADERSLRAILALYAKITWRKRKLGVFFAKCSLVSGVAFEVSGVAFEVSSVAFEVSGVASARFCKNTLPISQLLASNLGGMYTESGGFSQPANVPIGDRRRDDRMTFFGRRSGRP